MKFTQTDAAKKISSILTRGGKDQQLSDRTIAENIDSLMKALVNDETELDDFIKTVEPMFKTWQNNAKKDSSDFIDKWKEEHPEQPIDNPADNEKKKETEKSDVQKLMERIAALEKDREESTKRASIEKKRKDVEVSLREKGVKDDKWLSKILSMVNIDEKTDVDTQCNTLVEVYNLSRANGGKSVPPGNPNSGGGAAEAFKQSVTAAANLAKQGQPEIKPKQ